MNKQNGSAIIPVLLTSLAILAVCTTIYSMILNRTKVNQTLRNYGTRDALAANLDRAIRDPAALSQSLYDQGCLTPLFQSGAVEQIYTSNSCFIDNISSDTDSSAAYPGFKGFALSSPPSNPGSAPTPLAGTFTNPVQYSELGVPCTLPTAGPCKLQATAMYQYFPSGSSLTPGAHVLVQYIVQGISNGSQVPVKVFSSTAETALSTISRVSDPTQYGACRSPAAMTKLAGQVTYDLAFTTSTAIYPPTSNPNEAPVCSVGVGLQLCPNNSYQVGLNTDGTPICSAGNKNVCPAGSVAIQVQNSGAGGFSVACMQSSCASTAVSGVNRLGFVSPSGSGLPTDPVNCVIIQPKPGCELMAKTTIDSGSTNAGLEDCSTTGSIPSVGAPPPPPLGCTGGIVYWAVGTNNCQGPVTSAASGSPAQPVASTGPNSGNANFSCNSGAWVGPAAGYTCTAPPSTCPAVPLITWTVASTSCSGSLVSGISNANQAVTSITPAGSANYLCTGGSWVLQPGDMCTPPATKPCSAATLSWTVGGNNCSGPASLTAASSSAALTSTNGDTGTATFACDALGNWATTPSPLPVATCTAPASSQYSSASCDSTAGPTVTCNCTYGQRSDGSGLHIATAFTTSQGCCEEQNEVAQQSGAGIANGCDWGGLPPIPIAGVCGPASGVLTSQAPTSGLCVQKWFFPTLANLNSGGAWEWYCSGIQGGATTTCNAPASGGSCGSTPGVGWVVAGVRCSGGPRLGTINGGLTTVNATGAHSGSATYTCTNGVWGGPTGASCM